MGEWKEYKLGEICTELSDGLHKAPIFIDGGDYIFVNAKNIANGFIVDNDPEKKSTYEEYLKYSSPLNETTILYSIDGTIGNIALYRGEKCILGKGACYINPNPTIIDRLYLYYELQSPRFKAYIDRMSTGSTIQHISLKTMRNYTFTGPSLTEQKRIASILTSLDDKIDLLRRENATLEAMAETLFRQWFVVEAKEEWEERKLGDFFDVKTGKRDANYSVENGSFPFFTCSKQTLSAPNYSFEGSAILLAGNGDFNVKRYVGKFEAYQRTYVLIPYDVKYFNFLYIVIKYYLDEITGGHRGSVISFITKGMIIDFPVGLPIENIDNKLKQFDVIFEKVDANVNQIQTFIQTRDGLLPKLMSNEIISMI